MISMVIKSFEIEILQKVTGALFAFGHVSTFQPDCTTQKAARRASITDQRVCTSRYASATLTEPIIDHLHDNVSGLPRLPRLARLALIGRGWTPLIRVCEQKFDKLNYLYITRYSVRRTTVRHLNLMILIFFRQGYPLDTTFMYRGVLQSILRTWISKIHTNTT